jgi:hypothetical protein
VRTHEPQRPFRVVNVAEQPARTLKGDAGPRTDIADRIERLAARAALGLSLFPGRRDGAPERGERVTGE